ncbi:MAG: arylsulfatase [Chthoniobacter sp.]|uniref:arylsulfatase n=1 Tax=Chthoniobacter sp. TaxID=2510640 RepID=UPI0032A42669
MSRLTALLLAALVCFAHAAEPAKASKPNVIFILADDLGIGDLGCYGQQKIQTPNIDHLAADGLRFLQHYTGNAVCAPSRCALMTGKHMGHAAIRDNMQRGPSEEGQRPMPAGTVTVAQRMRDAGYYTGIIGKWGLGMPEDHSSPRDFGFNYSYGYLCQSLAHTYYPPYLWRNNERESLAGNPSYDVSMRGVIEPKGQLYAHDLMANDALKFVRDHHDQPFFLYLAFTIPHLSLQVPDDSMAQYHGQWTETPFTNTKHYANNETPRAAYAGMITRMDRDIGRVMALLKELGIDDNTLVFFSSDNGAVFPLAGTDPVFFQSTGGLRGYKQDLYEGGIRTPLIARWPGKIKAGDTTGHVSAFYDFLPTMAELTGGAAPADTDGISYLPTLLGQPGQKQHDFLYWEYESQGGRVAVRMGDWKAIANGVKKNPNAPFELYNLAADRAESHDLGAEHPELIAKAKEIIRREHQPSPVKEWNFELGAANP